MTPDVSLSQVLLHNTTQCRGKKQAKTY